MNKTCNYYVTYQCNDSCEFGHVWQDENLKEIEEKPYDLSRLKDLGVTDLNITGGEPLLREDLPQILKQARELGFNVNLSTNGILYADKARLIAPRQSSGQDRLMFSLDYPFAEMHDRSRGVECFHDVIKNIKLAQELGQKPIVKYTMTRDSVLYLPEMMDLAVKLNVVVYLSPVYDFAGTQGFERATISHLKYYFRRRNVLLNLAALEFVKTGGNKLVFPRCKASETTVTILPDGSQVAPCFFNQGGRQGRETVCSSCMRWPYMLPSFSTGFDKYYLLNLYSNFINRRKL